MAPRADLNNVGNLVLHLTGNVRQLICSELGGAPDVRDRQAEFDARGPVPRADLLAALRAAVADAAAVLTGPAADWSRACSFRGQRSSHSPHSTYRVTPPAFRAPSAARSGMRP